MKIFFHIVVAGFFAGSALAAQPLLNPAELQVLIKAPNVRVVDIREAKLFSEQHVPSAVSAPYAQWRGANSNPGDLPDAAKLTELVQSLGVTPATHVVVVAAGTDPADFGSAARVYWTLKVLGLKELSILNGGARAWSTASLPTDAAVTKPARSSFVPKWDTAMLVNRTDLVQQVAAGKVNLVDAREMEFFEGDTRHPAAKVAGTIKGAVNLEHSAWFPSGTSVFATPAQAQKVLANSAPLVAQKETVTFCNTGHLSATNWFALSEVLGQKSVKMYAGSMVDWTQDVAKLPMDNVPSRAKQLMMDARMALNR
jgi:thiosulfate/3-mercaptopyruvate sulfurtransferase